MNEFRLAERVVELCPEVMGMNRVAQEVVRDPRVVSALVDLVEDYVRATEEWKAHSQVLADQRDWANSEIKRLRKVVDAAKAHLYRPEYTNVLDTWVTLHDALAALEKDDE